MRPILIVLVSLFLLTACNSQHALTKEEIAVQSQADIAVSNILFDAGMDTKASYNVRKSGHVEIEFVKGISMIDYTLVVEKLREHNGIATLNRHKEMR